MASLSMSISNATILRSVNKIITAQTDGAALRVEGVDELASRKGRIFRTGIVDVHIFNFGRRRRKSQY